MHRVQQQLELIEREAEPARSTRRVLTVPAAPVGYSQYPARSATHIALQLDAITDLFLGPTGIRD